ncbi:hypothetical protein QE3_1708, partial [Clostridioides difficile CD88]
KKENYLIIFKDNNMKIIFILKNMNESSGFYKKTYLDFNI